MRFRSGHITALTVTASIAATLCFSCASVGTPDGGRYDEEAPIFLGSTPKRGDTNVDTKNVTLEFDEIVKIENAAEKVVISPPQKEQAEIQVNNKKIQIKLQDSLQENTTYTIDFADAIVDNNEGNPLGDFCFSFSTGDKVDTFEVSGYVLNAQDLEPIKGILVGLYSDLDDSCFTTKPFERQSRTDASGHFTVRGLSANKQYRIFALQDQDQNFYFSQKSEMIAWYDSLIIPTSEPAVRYDSIKNLQGEFDSLKEVAYTRFMPDDIVMLAFKETPTNQYLVKRERPTHEKFTLTFALPADTLPALRGLNFDETDAFIMEKRPTNDSIVYWMTNTLLYYMDTLSMELTYMATDTLGQLVQTIDTLNLVPKKSRARILEDQKRKAEEEQEKFEKELKKLEKNNDSVGIAKLMEPKISYLTMKVDAPSTMDLNDTVSFKFEEPVLPFNPDSLITLRKKVDSLYVDEPFEVIQDTLDIKKFYLFAEWRPEESYKLEFDSAGVQGIYGKITNKSSHDIKFNALDKYSTFTVNVKDAKPGYTLRLYSGKKIEREEKLEEDGHIDMFFLKPGSYYIGLLDDTNGNGHWDTGDWATRLKPESVYYLDKKFDLKQNWDHSVDWDITALAIDKQKPDEIKSQKAETKKEKKSRNAEREAQMAKNEAKSRKSKRQAEKQKGQ